MRYNIEGGSLPVAILKLEAGETVISESGGRTWMRGPIVTDTTSYGGAGKALGRLFMGESLFMSKYTANGPAEIAFASSFPGRIIAKELAPGQSIICQKTAFLCGMGPLELAVHFRKKLGSGFFSGEGFIMQRVTGPGIVFLEVDGYSPEYDLAPGEQIICDTGVLAAMEDTCSMDIQVVRGAKNMFFGGEGIFNTVVTGPGKVYLQSMTVEKLARLMDPYLPRDVHHD